MVGVVEWVYGIVAECVYVEGTVGEELDLWRFLHSSRGTVMAASSALLFVCLFSCDLISICVVVSVRGLAMHDPNVGFPDFCHP